MGSRCEKRNYPTLGVNDGESDCSIFYLGCLSELEFNSSFFIIIKQKKENISNPEKLANLQSKKSLLPQFVRNSD